MTQKQLYQKVIAEILELDFITDEEELRKTIELRISDLTKIERATLYMKVDGRLKTLQGELPSNSNMVATIILTLIFSGVSLWSVYHFELAGFWNVVLWIWAIFWLLVLLASISRLIRTRK